MGAGEILLTSVDREGTRKDYDVQLVKAVSSSVSVPVIACGGMGTMQDMVTVVKDGDADAVAMADILHYNRATMMDIREYARSQGIEVRNHDF